MAKRICFISTLNNAQFFNELEVEFKYYNGFAITQKQKSIIAFHESIRQIDNSFNILEVSTKSTNPIGVALSAFNLKFYDEINGKEYALENIFQSSKVFKNGGPYRDLLNVHPRDAKRDERLLTSGLLKHFQYGNVIWELEPKTMFYDWIYITALHRNKDLREKILDFNAFTDIEFNQEKSINCQARSAAIYVSLCKRGIAEDVIKDKEKLRSIYPVKRNINVQASMFD